MQEPKGFVDMLAAGLSLGLHLKVAACGKKLVAVDILLIRWVWDRIRNLTTFPLSILILCHNMRDPHHTKEVVRDLKNTCSPTEGGPLYLREEKGHQWLSMWPDQVIWLWAF